MRSPALFLTGAPTSSSLEWDSANLLEAFTPPFARFAGLSPSVSSSKHSSSGFSEPGHASWRFLDVDRQHLPTGYSQRQMWTKEYQGDADFFNKSSLSFASISYNLDTRQSLGYPESSSESIDEVLSQFYEHSFAVHTTTLSSQVTVPQSEEVSTLLDSDTGTPSANIETSFTSETDSFSVCSPLRPVTIRPAIPVGNYMLGLGDVPNAKYLDSIQPQTMTINVIVGIISVAPPRAIKTRRGAEVDLVELLVGDETKSGFGINFWLSARLDGGDSEKGGEDIRNGLLTLRPQDIILLRNVALSSFRGKVYGQSLKKDTTKLYLLYRNRIDRTDVGGYYTVDDFDIGKERHSQLMKTMHVRDWVLRFVAPSTINRGGISGTKIINESLPLDTQ